MLKNWLLPSRDEFFVLLFSMGVFLSFKFLSGIYNNALWSAFCLLVGSILITKSRSLLTLLSSYWKKLFKKHTLEWVISAHCSNIDLQKLNVYLQNNGFSIDAISRHSLKSHRIGVNVSVSKSIDRYTDDLMVVEGRGNPRDLIEDYEKIFLKIIDSCESVVKIKLSISFLSDELKEKVKKLFRATAVPYLSADIEIGSLKASIENNTITVTANSPQKLFTEAQRLVISLV